MVKQEIFICIWKDSLVTFILACEMWNQVGASHFAWICCQLPRSCVYSSALLPKQSHALTQAISGCLISPRGRDITWKTLPLSHLWWLYDVDIFKAFWGFIKVMTELQILTGCDSVSCYNRTIRHLWPQRLTHINRPAGVSWKHTEWSRCKRKCSWIAACSNRKVESSLSPCSWVGKSRKWANVLWRAR